MRTLIIVLVTTLSLWVSSITGKWVIDESTSLKHAVDDYNKLIIGMQVKQKVIYEFLENGVLTIYREGHKGEKGSEGISYTFDNGVLSAQDPESKIEGRLGKDGKLSFIVINKKDKSQKLTFFLARKGTAQNSTTSIIKTKERVVETIELKPSDFPWTKETVKKHTLQYPKVNYLIQETNNTFTAEIFSDGGEFYQYQASDGSFSHTERWRKFSPFFTITDNVKVTPIKKEKIKTSAGTFETIKIRFDNLEGNYAWLILEKPGIYAKYTNGFETYLLQSIKRAEVLDNAPIMLDRVYKSSTALRGQNVFCTFLSNGYFKYILSSENSVNLANIDQHSERFKIEGDKIVFVSDGTVLDIQSSSSFKLFIRRKELLFQLLNP